MTRMSAVMTEAQLQAAVLELAALRRVAHVHHETDSRRSQPGLPDLILVGRRVEFWELKTATGRVRPEQLSWLQAIARADNGIARVVRPAHLADGHVDLWLRQLTPRWEPTRRPGTTGPG